MKLAVVQYAPHFKKLKANLEVIHDHVDSVKADVIVFPELATSGYFYQARNEAMPFALAPDSNELHDIVDKANAQKKVIVLGFAERDGNLLYNSALVAGHDIEPRVYRKTHLFYREFTTFEPGNTGFFVVNLPHLDCNLGTMVCYDWRFPESSRALGLKGADVIAAPSNLVTHIWPKVMPARAIENKVYLAVANRVGSEENNGEVVKFNGQSAIYGYNGSEMEQAGESDESVLIADVDPAKTRDKSFNEFNDIFADRRPDIYEL